MRLGFAAGLALLLGAVALLGYLHIMGRSPTSSPEARHLRAMKERLARPDTFATFSFDDFRALPRFRMLAEYAPLERRSVSLEGYCQRVLHAVDGDFHLEIGPRWRAPGAADSMYVTAEITPGWQSHSRSWRYEPLIAAFHPTHGGVTAWEGGTARVRISGWLLYDFQYDALASPWVLEHEAPRLTGWEIHPVTRIELWSDSLAHFMEYRR